MLVFIINDSHDEYAKIGKDFYSALKHIGEIIGECNEESPSKIRFTSEQFKWRWEIIDKEENTKKRSIELLFSRFGCTKGTDCCRCEFKCANCKNFLADHDNNDYRCYAQHFKEIDGIEITCMDCPFYQAPNNYPFKDIPKYKQKSLI